MPDQNEIELRWILAVIRRWRWLIAGSTILAAVAAFAFTSWMPPEYEATVTLYVEQTKDTGENNFDLIVAGERLALTYSQMLKGRSVLETVISELGLKETPDKLAERITVDPIRDTQLIRVMVKDSSPSQGARLANSLADALIAHIEKLQAVRYTNSLASAQADLDTLSARIDETESKIDSLSAQKISFDGELSRLLNLLDDTRSDNRALKQSYQSLQLTVTQLTDKVKVIEAAHEPQTPAFATHSASLMLLIDPSLMNGENSFSDTANSELLALTYGPIIKGRTVLKEAGAKLGLQEEPETLAKKVSIEPVLGTQLIELTVQSEDGSQAIKLADAIAETFVGQIRTQLAEPYADRLLDLQAQMDEFSAQITQWQEDFEAKTVQQVQAATELARLENLQRENRSNFQTLWKDYDQLRLTAAQAANSVVIAEDAHTPESPVQYQILYTALAALVGLMVGSGSAFLLESLKGGIRDQQEVSTTLGMSTSSRLK